MLFNNTDNIQIKTNCTMFGIFGFIFGGSFATTGLFTIFYNVFTY